MPPSYDCNTFRPGVDAEVFFALRRLQSASQRKLVEQPSKAAFAAYLSYEIERDRLDGTTLDAALCAVQAATVTPWRSRTASSFGISGGPTGISWSTAVNIWAAKAFCPVISSIRPPPLPY